MAPIELLRRRLQAGRFVVLLPLTGVIFLIGRYLLTDNASDWTPIATISNEEVITEHVSKALISAKIDAVIGGSKSYGIRVHSKDANRAIKILRADSQKHRYWILLNQAK